MTDDSGTKTVVTIGDVLARYGNEWQIETSDFCLIAVRQPTPTAQEIVTGRDASELATKLAAEEAASDG
jgi:hypothetical protein